MKIKPPQIKRCLLLVLTGLFAGLIQNIGVLPKFGMALPLLLIPFTVAVAVFEGEYVGAVAGLLSGIFIDIFSTNAICYSALSLMVIGCVCGLFIRLLMRRVLFSALILSIFSCIIYFGFSWLFFYVIPGTAEPMTYLTDYILYAAVYSALLIIPQYYIVKLVCFVTK